MHFIGMFQLDSGENTHTRAVVAVVQCVLMMMMTMVRSVNVLSARVFDHAFVIYRYTHTHGIPENMMCDYRIGVVNGLSETKSKPNKKPVAVERLRWPTDPLGRRTRPLSQMKERASVHPSDANPNNHHQQQHPHTHMRLILIIIASFEPPAPHAVD